MFVKIANAAFFSLAAVPAYFIARRVARPPLALGVAALTVLVPARSYAHLVLTESVGFMTFLLAVLAIVRALERPSVARQFAALGLVALAVETRRQSLVLVALLPCAIAIETALTSAGARDTVRRATRRFLPVWLVLGAALAAVAVCALVRGRSPFAVLGPFQTLSRSYDLVDVAVWLEVHLAVLGLTLAVVPLVALPFGLSAALRRGAPPQWRTVGAVAAPLLLLLLVQVAAFSSTPFGLDPGPERYLFYVAPLTFCLLALWIETGLRGSRWAVVVMVVVVSLLPLAVPTGLLETPGIDAPTLSVLGLDPDETGPRTPFHLTAVIWSMFLALWVLLDRSRRGVLLLAVVAAAFVLTNVRVHDAFATMSRDQAALAGARSDNEADWIDRAVGKQASITILAVAAPATCPTSGTDPGTPGGGSPAFGVLQHGLRPSSLRRAGSQHRAPSRARVNRQRRLGRPCGADRRAGLCQPAHPPRRASDRIRPVGRSDVVAGRRAPSPGGPSSGSLRPSPGVHRRHRRRVSRTMTRRSRLPGVRRQ